jgi:hypothetical protein
MDAICHRTKYHLKFLSSVEKPGFYGARRTADDFSDFLNRIPFHIMQLNDDALLFGHAAKSFPHKRFQFFA